MPALNKTAKNERRKITATAVSNLGVSLIVTGVFVPIVSLAYQMTFSRTRYWSAFAVLWALAGIGFHLVSRRIMGRLEE